MKIIIIHIENIINQILNLVSDMIMIRYPYFFYSPSALRGSGMECQTSTD